MTETNNGKYRVDGSSGDIPGQYDFCGCLTKQDTFIEITEQRIKDHIKAQSADGCEQCPFKDLLAVIGLCDLTTAMCNDSGDQTDAEL